MAEQYAIEMRGITKTFGSVVANKGVNLNVKNGEILLYHSSDYEEVMKVQRDITRWLQSEAFSTFEMPTADEGGDA